MSLLEIIGLITDIGMAGLVSALFVIVWNSRDKIDERSDGLLQQALTLFAGLNEFIQANTKAIEKLANEQSNAQLLSARVHRDMQSEHGSQRVMLTTIQDAVTQTDKTMIDAREIMRSISQRREAQHAEIMATIQPLSERIDAIMRHITIATDENTLRHEVSKAVLLLSEIKRLLTPDDTKTPDAPEPGEQQTENTTEVTSDGK